MIGVLVAALVAAQPAPADFASYPVCVSVRAPIHEPCKLSQTFDAETASRLIGTRNTIWWLHGDALTMIARPTALPWVALCCSIQTGLDPIIGADLAAGTVRVPHLDEAVLDIKAAPGSGPTTTYRGIHAPPAPARSDPLQGTLIDHDFASPNLHEHRSVWFYVPPNLSAGTRLPVVYMADGGAKDFAPIAEALILRKQIRPLILVGIEAATPSRRPCLSDDCDRRGKEYEAGHDAADTPFKRHLHFLIEEVAPYVAAHYPVSKDRRERALAGTSQGAVWAAQTAELRPDLFGAAIVLSGTGSVAKNPETLGSSRIFVSAGEFEADRLGAMKRFAEKARVAHADVQVDTIWAGHSDLTWDILLARALIWLYPYPYQ